jgi:putative FmdB family regulatory protein
VAAGAGRARGPAGGENTLEPGRCCMPTYVFKCGACGEQFEKVMSLSEREKGKQPSCPKCKKHKVERVFTSFYAKTARKS